MDKISIVIPVYNTRKEYLNECIESVLIQKYTNIEVLIIDDGSKNETRDLCDSYMNRDLRVRVIHKKNEGVSVARNTGIKEATGNWIFFLDSDDWLEEDCFEDLEKYLEQDGVFFKRKIHEKNQIRISDFGYCEMYNADNTEKVKSLVKGILINNDLTSTVGMCTSKLYNLDFLRLHNINFPVGVPFREDSIFNILFLQKSTKVLLSTKVVYNYRINIEAVTQKRDTKYIENNAKLLKACKEILDEEFLSEYYAFVIWQLNYICIKNIFIDEEKEKIKKLKEIIKDKEYIEAIKKIDLKIISSRKQILVFLLRMKWYFLLRYLYLLKVK